jgi:hypothetical protein
MLLVEVQKSGCRPSYRGRADNAPIALKVKMFLPAVFTRMKQSNKVVSVSAFRIYRCDVWSLLQIAMQATEAKITVVIGSATLLGDDVIDLMRQDGGSLRQPTILANVLRPTSYPRSLLSG